MTLTQARLAALVAEANLAPSVHNTQPTRWRLGADGSVLVFEDRRRRLAVGDPEGRDAGVSHGAAIEGLSLACAGQGLGSVSVEAGVHSAEGDLLPVAQLRLAEAGPVDPLQAAVPLRWTYRGAFAKGEHDRALAVLENHPDVTLVRDVDGIAQLATMNDAASLRTFRDAAFRAELVSWMRLSRQDPRWASDGLNAEAMQMSPLEAAGAGTVLKPGIFEMLDRIGLSAPLVAEAKVVRSAAAIALFHRPVGEAPLETGRRFYRFWLEVAAQGLTAAPMAVLADDAETRAEIAKLFNLPANRRLITTFKLGLCPKPKPARRPRLNTDLLLI